ncbi:MAG: helix-turn-helix domain-containing protein [Thermoplasmata archaeon]|nr:helix-turn-helix domain-containing protein [Candidatus Sysuiplasma jiujiangense]
MTLGESVTPKKLTMATNRLTYELLDRALEELRTQYSLYDDLLGFPSVRLFVDHIEMQARNHPYFRVYMTKVEAILREFSDGHPDIMHVTWRESHRRFALAYELGKEIGIIDVEERGSHDGAGGMVEIVEASPELFLLPWIEDRIWKKQQNAMIAVVGLPGSGKSYGAIDIALELVERSKGKEECFHFDVERDVIFDIDTLVDMAYRRDERLPRGQIIIFDDMGVGAGNRDWQSDYNVILGKIAQSFRFMGFVLLVTMPKIEFIEKQVRELLAAKLISMTNENGENIIGCFSLEVACQYGEDIIYLPPQLDRGDFPDELGFEIRAERIQLSSLRLREPQKPVTELYEARKESELRAQVVKLRDEIEQAKNMDAVRREALTAKYTALKEKVEELAEAEVEAKKAKFEAEIEEAETRKQKARRERKMIQHANEEEERRKKKIIQLVMEGKSQAEIAKEMGVSNQAINQAIRRLRNRGELTTITQG